MSRLRLRRFWLAIRLLAVLGAHSCASAPESEVEPAIRQRRIRPTIAFEMLCDSPSLLVVDLRTVEETKGPLGRLATARNIPLAELESRLPELEEGGWKDRTFVVLCRGGDDCAERGMELLRARGFRYAVLMEGGIEGWIASGYGTVVEAEGEAEGVPTGLPGGPQGPGTSGSEVRP